MNSIRPGTGWLMPVGDMGDVDELGEWAVWYTAVGDTGDDNLDVEERM